MTGYLLSRDSFNLNEGCPHIAGFTVNGLFEWKQNDRSYHLTQSIHFPCSSYKGTFQSTNKLGSNFRYLRTELFLLKLF